MKKIHAVLFIVFVILQIIVSSFILSCIVLGGYIFLDDLFVLITKSKHLTENNKINRKAVYSAKIIAYILFLVLLIFNCDSMIGLNRNDILTGIAIVIAFETLSNSIEKFTRL